MKKRLIVTLLASSIVTLTGLAQANEELPEQAAEQATLQEANRDREKPEQAHKGTAEEKKAQKEAEKEARKAEKKAEKAEKKAEKAEKKAKKGEKEDDK